VSVVRALFPDSTPTKVTTRADGTVEIILGGGPTSGGFGQQAAAIAGMAGSVAQGRVAKEVVETVVDATVQEATGAPVGPSVLASPPDQANRSGTRSEPVRITEHPTSKGLYEIREMSHPERWRAGEEYVRELYGGSPQRYFTVPQEDGIKGSGGRLVDVPIETAPNRTLAVEVKTYGQGKVVRGVSQQQTVSLTESIRQQLLKDAWLRDNTPDYDPRWIFVGAPPSNELANLLREHKIVTIVHGN
jgi:hypothetical protein